MDSPSEPDGHCSRFASTPATGTGYAPHHGRGRREEGACLPVVGRSRWGKGERIPGMGTHGEGASFCSRRCDIC
jgi:hypothetical protein